VGACDATAERGIASELGRLNEAEEDLGGFVAWSLA
jgi:hypothetical protein